MVKTILVAEDDSNNRMLLGALLESWGFGVVFAASAAEAMAVIEAGGPVDLLIIDLGLPDGDGLEVISAARQRLPEVQAIVSTGAVRLPPKAAEIPGPPLRLLVKPFRPDQLKRLVDRLVALD